MTVLAAVVKNNEIVLAADRMASAWHWSYDTSKLTNKRKMFFAGTGSCRAIQIVQTYLELPPMNEDHTEFSYMVDVAQAIGSLLKKYDCEKYSASFLVVGCGASIYEIGSDLSVMEFDKFATGGCGNDFATGVLAALYDEKGMDAESLAKKAIEIASEYSLYCGKGVDFVKLRLQTIEE